MNKLLLVNPYFQGGVAIPSLGLGFIASFIKKNANWEVEVIEPFIQGLTENQVIDKAVRSDIIGLVCYTESRFYCFNFAKKLKRLRPASRIIIGGPHVNTLDELILSYYPFVDVVVRNESEETMLEIVKDRPLDEIKGITWRKNGKIIRNPAREMVLDIDNLDYDYALLSPWIEEWKDWEAPAHLQKVRHLPIIASRGCPLHCSFCSANQQWGGIWRGLSPEKLVEKIKYLVNRYNIGYFRFYDSLFTINKKRILKFCELLEEEDLKVSFRIDIRVGEDRYILERLRKVGCDVVGFGVETGSDKILKRIHKGTTRRDIEETIEICKDLGFWTIGFFMISLPDETLKDIKKTLELIKYFDVINVQFFKVYPNNLFYDELKQKGETDDEMWFDRNYGFDKQEVSNFFYCKEMFPSASFYLNEVNLIIHYFYRVHRNINLRFFELIKDIFLSFLVRITLILESITILRLYLKLKDTRLLMMIKIFLKYLLRVR